MEEKCDYQQVLRCASFEIQDVQQVQFCTCIINMDSLCANSLYDKCSPAALISSPNTFSYVLQTDIRDYSAILAACEGADCVFHVASYGMSGTEQVSPHSFGFFCVTAHTEGERLWCCNIAWQI